MAELDSLLRVKRHEIDEKQKILASLYRKADEMKKKRDEIEASLAIETEKSKEMDAELLRYFLPYAEKMKKQIQDIDVAREQMEKKIEFAQDDMRESFAEMKKIEIIDERRKEEVLAEIEKRESELLDEIAIDGFRRNENE